MTHTSPTDPAPDPERDRADGLVEPEGVNAGSDVELEDATGGRTDVEGSAR